MNTARGWRPNLRYSPVNGIIVDWGLGSQPFAMCGMPTRNCEAPSPVPETDEDCPCGNLPMPEEVDTYDWARWVPEIIAGFSEASEDMAATYARRAAVEFAAKTRALQRQIAMRLQSGVTRYPLFPFEDEMVLGVLSIDSDKGACACECNHNALNIGRVYVHIDSNELRIEPDAKSCGCHTSNPGPSQLLATVWVAPTEDSCKHDKFLYERYRREITLGARAAFISEAMAVGSYKTSRGYANFRGDQLMFQRADKLQAEFQQAMRKARVEMVTHNAVDGHHATPLFAAGCCTPRRR